MTEKRLVNIGEGRIIEMVEGEGQKPSPKPRKPRAKKKPGPKRAKRKKAPPVKKHRLKGTTPGPKMKMLLIPGYREWWNLRQKQNSQYMIESRSRFGIPDGMRKAEALKAWAEARRKAEKHMANMKKAGLMPDDNEIIEKATLATLEILEGPMNQDMKLKAANQLLTFFKAKPASKSEVTVNAAEAWLASLAESEPND